MTLTLHEAGWNFSESPGGRAYMYRVDGLPFGENANIAEFNRSWRILRWKEDWHGNWTGDYATPEDALAALIEELLSAVA